MWLDKNEQRSFKPNRAAKYNKWAYTKFGFTDADIDKLKSYDCVEHYCAIEHCPTTGRPHLQGAIHTKDYHTEPVQRKVFQCDVRPSNASDLKFYINKFDNNLIINIDHRKQGHRTDLDNICKDISNGTRLDTLTLQRPSLFHQYGRTLSRVEDLYMSKQFRDFKTRAIWVYGNNIDLVSDKLFEGYNPETHYLYNDNDHGYWDGYTQQDTVIINDIVSECLPLATLCKLADNKPYNVPRRGRQPIPFISKYLLVGNKYHPELVYSSIYKQDDYNNFINKFEIVKVVT